VWIKDITALRVAFQTRKDGEDRSWIAPVGWRDKRYVTEMVDHLWATPIVLTPR
jgi:hypothetical protein